MLRCLQVQQRITSLKCGRGPMKSLSVISYQSNITLVRPDLTEPESKSYL